MATIVLSAAGMALGGSIGGTVLGLGMGAIGRAAGATIGRVIDQRIMGGGSEAVETGQIERFRLTGASEGAGVARLYGRQRLSGQVIWASEFEETRRTTGGGKGGASRPATTEFTYKVSVAIALCEGEISRVGRVWVDGGEIAQGDLNMRVYHGSETQVPDPKLEANLGVGQTPAYRGIAYVVVEDLELGQFGNRVPQFSFEVMRPGQGDAEVHSDLSKIIRGVALVPGTGEYSLATRPVTIDKGFGHKYPANSNAPSGKTDFVTSIDALAEELPNCGSVSVVVSWFGDDLRCGSCSLKPKIEQTDGDGFEMPWKVSGVARFAAEMVPLEGGRPVYGGTPADAAVIEALQDLKARGKKAVFYPFILMEQMDGNGLIDPWTSEAGQSSLPWRGRITTSLAPGQPGSPDATAQADQEVEAFFGAAQVADFTANGDTVVYTGPQEWSYRRFILHYAHLCATAGSVDAFCIGSEMRSLTQIRGAAGFPAVEAMMQLAADVRAILGSETKIGYAADWSEYHGYQPVGTADKYFHLDPLWAHDDIDFIGIDNYMPLSDWRDGFEHLDADYGSIYNIEYLAGNIEGGEGFDWYYHSPEAVEAQLRTPITDGEGEPWIWRYKDIRSWWMNAHHNRINGQRDALPTDWEPGSKPIWFTEIGCAAVDKGTNEPNRFIDLKSSESGLPRASNGIRDDFIQMQYLRAIYRHYADDTMNPVSPVTGLRMVDPDRIHVWAWDARPFPAFPGNAALWSDHINYQRGHWINGRAASRPLSSVVAEICERSGITRYDVSELHGTLRGYSVSQLSTARADLQPLMMAYGFDAIERDGKLIFRTRGAREQATLPYDTLVYEKGAVGAIELSRAQEADVVGRVRVNYVASDGDYEARTAEAAFPDDVAVTTAGSDVPLVLTHAEAQRVSERWLSEARVARDSAKFTLPPSRLAIGAGDVVRLPDENGDGLFRIDQVELTDRQALEATRIEPAIYEPQDVTERSLSLRAFVAPVPVETLLLELPLLRGDEDPVAPYVAASGVPWPGTVALYSAPQDAGYALNRLISDASVIGTLKTPLPRGPVAVYDRGPAVQVKLIRGDLQSVSETQLLAGANLAAIGDGTSGNWEVIQFRDAQIVADKTYEVSHRLRGQAGTDAFIPTEWPVGSIIVMLDGRPEQIDLAPAQRGVEQHFRAGPGTRPLDDPSYTHQKAVFRGVGLRPYSVCHLTADSTGAGFDLTWLRRTRVVGDFWDEADVPLGETFERYSIRVFVGGVLKREVVTSTTSWQYSAAMMAQDGAGSDVRFDVAQYSDVFGEGPSRSLHVAV